MLTRLLSLFLLFQIHGLSAYAIKDSTKSIIVQFDRTVELDVLPELSHYKFNSIEPLNIEKTLFKFVYSTANLTERMANEIVITMPYYLLHQEDFELSLRATTPNDTLFDNQWHLSLIKAIQAWDITRSGVNRRGDTIVVAVVDDGLHINHPDFQGNIWINRADTLGNGIDDDGNGYIDDTYGWNFMGRNNDISDSLYYKAKHGTPVSGIIGARTNNVTGVSGIMWHVKLMIVNITDTGRFPVTYQSDVIKAYSYILHQRRLYNQTQGAKGAFVVVENSSWGIDGKFPNQAPLWCGFYDTMGAAGILNVSAVSNAQQQLDTYGDLPTLCTSEHLITVGNSTRYDNYAGGGYSVSSVDLFAPGSNIYTTAAYTSTNILLNQVYRDGFTGSSFASPMVAAAIGIMHTYACERILDTIKSNPAKGNLILRKLLFDGIDKLNTLEGKCLTGGRLNIQGALKMMDLYCQGEVGLSDTEAETYLELYPNPAEASLFVSSSVDILALSCTDLSGREVALEMNGGQIDISQLSQGVYILKLTTSNGVIIRKFVKS